MATFLFAKYFVDGLRIVQFNFIIVDTLFRKLEISLHPYLASVYYYEVEEGIASL